MGLSQIDAIWILANLEVKATSICPYIFSIGDYRVIIIDFSMKLIIEDEFILIVKSSIRRLISIQLQSVENYIKQNEELFDHYKITEKMESLCND